MKKFILTAFIFFICNFLYSQSVYVEYLESKKMSENSRKMMPKGMFAMFSKSYLYVLEFKNGESIYKNHPKSLNIKPHDTTYIDDGIEKKENIFNNQVEKVMYKNYATNELLYTSPRGKDEVAYVKEKLIDWNWTITNETKTINQFLCKKATATARGINFTVWFTEDIPIDAGPKFLNGLPGLIIYGENGNTIWEMKRIINNADVKIEKLNFDNQKTYTTDELEREIMGGRKNSNTEPIITTKGNTTTTKTTKVITN
ncbi:GLPGLI family protein [Flavobacterium sp. j3]|uniref:GLPGLI family protein n=1 Tax=Flavobacterium aureirubrum TaxID=3133147 RepID=A0ABU9N099_9FLAO